MTAPARANPLAAISADAEHATALPTRCYVDPDFFELEVERVMRRGWHAVARCNQLPDAGDYRSVDLFGEPIVVVRDAQRRLRAYSRVCRHRAMPIVEGEGNAKRFVCPYHRWSYDLDGELKSAPLMEDVDGFERENCRLPELPLEEWQGFAFVALDPAAPPICAQLAPLTGLLEPQGLAGLVTAGTLVFDSPWNWKVMVDNFIESYHHLGAHSENLQRSNPARGTHALDFEGPFLVLENPAVESHAPFWVIQVFPTLLLALFRDELAVGTWYEMKIDRHDHFELHIHLLLPPALATDAAAVDAILQDVRRVHAEDIRMCEGVQKGLQSQLWRPGRLSAQERTLWMFHRYLAEHLL